MTWLRRRFASPSGSLTLLLAAACVATLGYTVASPGPSGGLTLWRMTTAWPAFWLGLVLSLLCMGSVVCQLDLPRAAATWSLVFVAVHLVVIPLAPSGFLPHPLMGAPWLAQTESFLHGELGLPPGFHFWDVPQYQGRFYMPYPPGTALFPLLFGPYVKPAFIGLALLATLVYVHLSRQVHGPGARDLDVFVVVGSILSFLVIDGSSYYPAAFVGAALALALGFVALARYERSGDGRDVLAAAAALLAASLFRGELVLAMPLLALPVAARQRFRPRDLLRNWPFLGVAGITLLAAGMLLGQNELKFGDMRETGIRFNEVMRFSPNFQTPELFVPQGLRYVPQRAYDDFVAWPRLDCAKAPQLCLYFEPQFSEAGGFLFWRYPFLPLGFGALILALARRHRPSFGHLPWTNAAALAAGLLLCAFFLLNFNSTPRYHATFAPLLATSAAFCYPRQPELRALLHVFALVVAVAIAFTVFNGHPRQF